LKQSGFRVRGRTFNRVTSDGLTQVVNFQAGAADPPGTTYAPGLRENLYGLFTVNLGVYIPEVAAVQNGAPAASWVQDHACCIRQRLASVRDEAQEVWWHAREDIRVVEDLRSCLVDFGLPLLGRFATRDLVLSELQGHGANLPYCNVPRIVSAIILNGRNDPVRARALLREQTLETHNPGHPAYVRELADRLGVGPL
jgi:hypothetical protein